ncbi:MAG: hypothetical protein ACREBS_04080, partial [Nitrososphaerales archaeon]
GRRGRLRSPPEERPWHLSIAREIIGKAALFLFSEYPLRDLHKKAKYIVNILSLNFFWRDAATVVVVEYSTFVEETLP